MMKFRPSSSHERVRAGAAARRRGGPVRVGWGAVQSGRVVGVDGAGGYPPGAPYDRIIATCAVPAIPLAWLAQAAPGAVILADVHGPIGGTL
ncbi:MAG: hypothetical protein ACRDT0_01580, partial [Pseudonocardiaceae bacterium]